jgi:hypothetical protein
MTKVHPDTDRFQLIQLWLLIHCAIGYCIKRFIKSNKPDGRHKTKHHTIETLEHCFPKENIWFDRNELLLV